MTAPRLTLPYLARVLPVVLAVAGSAAACEPAAPTAAPWTELYYMEHAGMEGREFSWRLLRFRRDPAGESVSCMESSVEPDGCEIQRWRLENEPGATAYLGAIWDEAVQGIGSQSAPAESPDGRWVTLALERPGGSARASLPGPPFGPLLAVMEEVDRWWGRCRQSGSPGDGRTAPDTALIGDATMTAEGAVTLDLVAVTGETVGHAQFVYSPDDPEYPGILAHLDGLCPGQTIGVPPWPEPRKSD